MREVPFRYVFHLVTVPVVVDEVETEMVLDTGIGLTVLTRPFARQIGCELTGATHVGKRMSGQELSIPLTTVASLTFAGEQRHNLTAGIFDVGEIPGLEGIGGFLSLTFFRSLPLTFDYGSRTVIIEDENSLAARQRCATAIDVRVETDADATSILMPLNVEGIGTVVVEIDTGSNSLILNESLATTAGINLKAHDVRRVEDRDETGHEFVRYFTTLRGAVHVIGAPHLCQATPEVMFQEIIYDGLVGDSFLRNFTVTFDVHNSQVLFAGASEMRGV